MEEQEQPKVENEQQEHQQGSEKEAQKTFTRDQIGAMVDAQVKAKLDDINSSWQSKLDDAVAKAKEDGKAEANMSAKELAEKEAKDREDKLKQQMADLDKRQHELDHRDHISHTKDLLAEQNLPTSLAEMLLGETEEETKSNIETYKNLVAQGVRNELHRSSAGKAPQSGAPAQPQAPMKDISEMTYEEAQKYIESQNQ
nr:MAG TPA: Major head protein [Caudoviricetes sp.]